MKQVKKIYKKHYMCFSSGSLLSCSTEDEVSWTAEQDSLTTHAQTAQQQHVTRVKQQLQLLQLQQLW